MVNVVGSGGQLWSDGSENTDGVVEGWIALGQHFVP